MKSAAYSARRTVADGIEVAELTDAAHGVEVSIAPSLGNMAYEIKAAGKNILWFPYHSPAGFASDPRLCGVPFLAPWANRIDGDAYWVNGRRHPRMMAQFPFAHTIAMTYRLASGELEVETVLDNHSAEPMPVAIGYHPYFQLHDSPRDQWKVHLAAREHLVLSGELIPTGERKPVEFADPHPLHAGALDDVFGGLVRGPDGRAQFWVEGEKQRITVTYGPKYPVAVVYAPPAREIVCFEPMAAVTNGFNLAHAGVFPELQSIPPGGQWKESFWIRPSGF
ncbi:Aldose 1-epimerase [Candidatus Sulfopaludibacter sp. SbA4]|nr:Aldose 1-epimerase [Candidatus Sulfopaludibacter sp. SbA4]